jgi:hypothetical protein
LGGGPRRSESGSVTHWSLELFRAEIQPTVYRERVDTVIRVARSFLARLAPEHAVRQCREGLKSE